MRVPSEPSVADALASRAPYLQGRVSPESRFALYPEHVPSLVPVQGAGRVGGILQPQSHLLSPANLGSGVLQPQVVYMPTAGGQAVALGAGQTPGLPGQQWTGGGNSMMFVPTAQASGSGYYLAGAGGVGLAGGAGSDVVVAPSVQVVGGAYGGTQPVQLMALPDGSAMQAYPMLSGGVGGASNVAYAPVFAAGPAAGMSQWLTQPHSADQQLLHGAPGGMMAQQVGQQPPPPPPLQLVQMPEAEGAASGIGRGPQDQSYLLNPAAQIGAPRVQLDASYGVVGQGASLGPRSGGAPGVTAGMLAQASARSGAQDAASNMNELAQQMAGWQIH